MSEKHTLEGWLSEKEIGGYCEEHDAVILSNMPNLPLAEQLEFIDDKQVTVRYWVCETACSAEQASTDYLQTCMGYATSEYGAAYSEMTGYLWTTEKLQIGGHDLMAELRSALGKYLILEIEVH